MHPEEFHMYVLDGNQVRGTHDIEEWGQFMQGNERFLKQHCFSDFKVSSVFLGVDHRGPWQKNYTPILFETMVYTERYNDVYMQRYATMPECMKNHYQILSLAVLAQPFTPGPILDAFEHIRMRHHIHLIKPLHLITGAKS